MPKVNAKIIGVPVYSSENMACLDTKIRDDEAISIGARLYVLHPTSGVTYGRVIDHNDIGMTLELDDFMCPLAFIDGHWRATAFVRKDWLKNGLELAKKAC